MSATTQIDQNGAGSFAVKPEHIQPIARPLLSRNRSTAVGIRVRGRWTGSERIAIDGENHPVAYCTSALAVREVLEHHETAGGAAPVILTPMSEEDFGWDVLVRLARHRLIEISLWDAVRELFRVNMIDPRVSEHRWLAQVLVENAPREGYGPVPGAVLDADTAWHHVLHHALGLSEGRPDAEAILSASVKSEFVERFERLPAEAKALIRERFTETAGITGKALASTLAAGHGRLLVPIALACEVVFDGDAVRAGLDGAAVRLEQYVGLRPVPPDAAGQWASSARRVTKRLDDAERTSVGHDAERLLRDLGAGAHIHASDTLPGAFSLRLAHFAQALDAFVKGKAEVLHVEGAFESLEHHTIGRLGDGLLRRNRLRMAVRLVRYLAHVQRQSAREQSGFVRSAQAYVEEDSFVDYARTALHGGDPHPEVSSAVRSLLARVQEIRETRNLEFAHALAGWCASPSSSSGVVPIERLVAEVAAPLAGSMSVLLLVMDGMSFASFRELHAEIRAAGWMDWVPAAHAQRICALAVSPSITRLSRASLFAGRIFEGASGDEKRAFQAHPDLAAVSSGSHPPILFHKADLIRGSAGTLSEDVRETLRNPKQRVIGIVLNAIDDSLTDSDQTRPHWTLERVPLLQAILHEADMVRRAVILVSDHGHVLETEGAISVRAEAARWREYTEPLADGETALRGPRISAATGREQIVAAWSELMRYANKSTGYHGGASPQEMLVPAAVLTSWDLDIQGWQQLVEAAPAWWGRDEGAEVHVAEEQEPYERRTARAQATLFDPTPAPPEPPLPKWVDGVLASGTYAAQRKMAGRLAPPDKEMRAFLRLMAKTNGRTSKSAVAAALGKPELRIRGVLVALQRVLNVDGYPVVTSDDGTDSVELNVHLLARQFAVNA